MVKKKHPTSMLMYNNRGIIRATQKIRVRVERKRSKRKTPKDKKWEKKQQNTTLDTPYPQDACSIALRNPLE
jgi:hypothetical protein